MADERVADERVADERSERTRDEPANLGEAMEELGRVLGDLGESINESSVTPVDYRDLRETLPERVRGMDQVANSGERGGALGIVVSTVERTFRSDDGMEEIDISIVDLGTLKNAARMGMNWIQHEWDREDDRGFERTRTIDGHPAMERCERMGDANDCSLHMIVADRFVVQLESRGVEIDKLHDVLDDIDLRKLEKMRYEGVKDVQ